MMQYEHEGSGARPIAHRPFIGASDSHVVRVWCVLCASSERDHGVVRTAETIRQRYTATSKGNHQRGGRTALLSGGLYTTSCRANR